MEQSTSASLLERLRRPDDALAWSRFVELYTPLLFFWAQRLGLSAEDAEDLVQDVFVTLVQKLPGFAYDRRKTFRGWLRKVLVRKWLDRQRRACLPTVAGAEAGDVAGPEGTPFWEGEHRQFLVRRALEVMQADFEPRTWEACWKFVALGEPAAQVAADLGIKENAVYVAKCRVLRRLRDELSELLG
jgi:RNA polymerase sigma-70 factor (ECF subfamily)